MSKPTADQIRNAMPLAKRFIDAYQSDIDGDGCDIQAGLFGPALSALIVEMNELCMPPETPSSGLSEGNKKAILREQAHRIFQAHHVDVSDVVTDEVVAKIRHQIHTECGTVSQWRRLFPIGVLGHPMREYAPGKWESADWPSEKKPPKGGTWEENVEVLLKGCPHTVRDLSGDVNGLWGKEYLIGSLCITFSKMQNMLKEGGVK